MTAASRWQLALLTVPLLLGWALAQSTVTAANTAVSPSYRVGPGDVLSLRVYGDDELNAPQLRVDQDGTIHIPYSDKPVQVDRMRVDQIQTAVAQALVADQLTAAGPRVDISVIDVESKPITISGAVRAQGEIQAVEPIHLLEVLDKVGGVDDTSGAQIMVIAHNPDGTDRVVQTVSADELLRTHDPALNPLLTGGEELRVLPGGHYYVTGAVGAPGEFALSDSDPQTVRKAMALAKTIASTANLKGATLTHGVGSAHEVIVPIDVKSILTGKAPDIKLAANDMINIPFSTGKKVGLTLLDSTRSVLTAAAAVLIVQ